LKRHDLSQQQTCKCSVSGEVTRNTLSQKCPPFYFLKDSVKNYPILVIFVRKILRKFYIELQICPPHLQAVAIVPREIQRVSFDDSFICDADCLRHFTIKQTVTIAVVVNLPTTSKNVTALPCKVQNSFVWWKAYFPLQTLVALKQPVVLWGTLNVRQATSQQVFKVTIICMDTRFQSFSH